ncbi:MAG: dihydropteroate synthase [Propionibacteriaceae bacterium]|jgi:dihydropteroate synthase|nr:dihydropteroate synthase [Propionibacteriaceae bacterium]
MGTASGMGTEHGAVHTIADVLTPGPTRLMGIVNVTADSFSEPIHRSVRAAIDWGIELVSQGADLIDVGGESTRPGAERVDQDAELARVLPVVEALAGSGVPVSVDTVRSAVARAAIDAGAVIVNDVSGGLTDPGILQVVADSDAGYVLQHWRRPFDHGFSHRDVVAEVCEELATRRDAAVAAGIDPGRIILDPGIGFGKTPDQNWELIAHSDHVAALGHPVLWGVSRKRFLAQMYPEQTQPWQRDAAGVAVTALLARQGVWGVRVHTASDHRAALGVAEAVRAHGTGDRVEVTR